MKGILEQIGLALLHKLPPEAAHNLSLHLLRLGLAHNPGPINKPCLSTIVAGLEFINPVGLAAGYDKNAEALSILSRMGFGFIEVGAATPKPQSGNLKPRLFRLDEDKAVINNMGFNNIGMALIVERLKMQKRIIPVGLNLGANKESKKKSEDYSRVLECCGSTVDFVTVNVSSPNTKDLRDLQSREALSDVMSQVTRTRDQLKKRPPIFLKIAPDLNEQQLVDIANVSELYNVDAIIATNTTLSREGLTSDLKSKTGGLSGQPLFEQSTRILAKLSTMTDLPLIGVGGVANAAQAFDKICAGASAVQMYTSLVFGGFSLVREIVIGLADLLEENGFDSVSDAIGSRRDEWL
ncbi:MAG: quinone-dependent dihydroorotate dehydrogenase [Aestuariivita sp.]|nr:quinone-dependent dihydroorotate dehydrogenase [Aestuariivita sp.]